MKPILLTLVLVAFMTPLWGQQQPPGTADVKSVATTWNGINFEVFAVQRIAGDRLLVGVRIVATAQAAETTFIAVEHKIPPNASPFEIGTGKYRPDPVYIDSAIMTEETTKQTFSTVEPAPNGPGYPPSGILASLNRGEVRLMSIQFPSPPPPPPVNGIVPKQTVSILLPNARGPITKIPLPPPLAPAPAAAP